MSQENSISSQIEAGNQLGLRFSFSERGKTFWSSVGIQFHEGTYKVYVDEIDEQKMDAEEYEKEEGKSFSTLSEAFSWMEENSKVNRKDLRPCKALKIFNPLFVE